MKGTAPISRIFGAVRLAPASTLASTARGGASGRRGRGRRRRRLQVRRQHGRKGGALLRKQLPITHQSDLMQPGPAPLQRPLGKRNSGLKRKQAGRLLLQSSAIDLTVKGAPVATAGIEAN